jgi:hypothetical protein
LSLPPDSNPPPELFHYTSAVGALGILRDGILRAGMLHYMNDGQEFAYAIGMARRILEEIEKENGDEGGVVRAGLTYLTTIEYLAVFAFSLSENGDLLSQWRAYCPPEGGYSVGFATEHIQAVAVAHGFKLVQCEYNPERQLALLRPVVNRLVETIKRLGVDTATTDVHHAFTDDFADVAVRLKHPAFEEEREWRLAASPKAFQSAEYVAKQTLIVPFLPLSVKRHTHSPVSRVIVGPHPYPELAGRSLRFMTTLSQGWPVKVDSSKTPYRVIG